MSKQELYSFVHEYVLYWGDSDYEQSNLTSYLLKQAGSKRDYIQKVLADRSIFSDNTYINPYLKQLGNVFQVAKNSSDIQQTEENLLFHYLHMMNNRIGVWPLEEAYLAALLLRSLQDNGTNVSDNDDCRDNLIYIEIYIVQLFLTVEISGVDGCKMFLLPT